MEMTLAVMLELVAQKYSEREAVLFEDARATYAQLDDAVNRRANALLQLGIGKGDHVGTLFSNCMEAIETFFAVWRIGAVLVPLNFRLSPSELAFVAKHSDLSSIVFLEHFAETVRTLRPDVPQVERFLYVGERSPSDFIDLETAVSESSSTATVVAVTGNDHATIIYTAGTTGIPKGVMATHGNWMWSVVNMVSSFPVSSEIKSLTVYPFFHAAAFANLLSGLFMGAALFVAKAFDPQRILELIQEEGIGRLGNPPTVYNMILQVPGIDQYDLSSVRYLMSGSEVMPDEVRNKLKKVFPGAGIFDNYGMTETCGFQTSRSAEYTESKPYSVGLPAIALNLRLVDQQGLAVPAGEIGEITVRGPNVMKGYYRNPEKTAEAIRDGWLYTSDLGRLDKDGFLTIVERKNHMIISGGENIYPKEVEDVLYRHSKVGEAAVFGLPDTNWGEKVCAAVVLNPGESAEEEEIVRFCQDNLAGFKKPKRVIFMDALPRSPIGKVLRSVLKKRFMEE
ncbi:MAG: long-chain fatty acid--CoA ligase [Proteobacteria bacterium]|nr:long-chain fatty acid--CoA ligase [Pseudomonadota bacterium]